MFPRKCPFVKFCFQPFRSGSTSFPHFCIRSCRTRKHKGFASARLRGRPAIWRPSCRPAHQGAAADGRAGPGMLASKVTTRRGEGLFFRLSCYFPFLTAHVSNYLNVSCMFPFWKCLESTLVSGNQSDFPQFLQDSAIFSTKNSRYCNTICEISTSDDQ